MNDILEIQSGVAFDESISHYEVHSHQPYNSANVDQNDEIRISIQNQDLCVLPSQSYIHVIGRLRKTDGNHAQQTSFVNNGVCFLFDEIRYELNSIEIDKCKNVGLTTLMKGWPSFNANQKIILENAGWMDDGVSITDNNGYFDVFIPLNILLGFAEDYRKIIVNMKHELIITRSRTDINSTLFVPPAADDAAAAENITIKILKIEWLMPYVQLSTEYKIRLLRQIEKNRPITMSFRSWELYEYPILPSSTSHVWTVKTSNQLEKPRFVIIAFQTNKKNQPKENAALFDHCQLSNVKLFLNSQSYPYGNMNLDIANNQFAVIYDMFANFQRAYYGKNPEPLLTKNNFISKVPLLVIDCSKQNESLKNAPVDVRVEFETKQNIPANTSAYCLILHDRVVEYNVVSGDVRKFIQ